MTEDNGNQGEGPGLPGVIQLLHDLLADRDFGEMPHQARERQERIYALTSTISEAGLDGEALVRFGFTYDIAIALVLAFASGTHCDPAAFHRWSAALGLDAPFMTEEDNDDGGKILSVPAGVIPMIVRWVYVAPFEDIVSLTPPCDDVERRMRQNPEPQQEVLDEYRWIIDRLSGQPVEKWQTRSLELEFLWRRGKSSANLPDRVLVQVPIETAEVAVVLADRSLTRDAQPRLAMPALMDQLDAKAKSFLRARRFSDAATLFEFMADSPIAPKDRCLNNRGFCWIPDDPKRALHFLQEAAAAGYQPVVVNVYNQICCMHALGDSAGVRSLSEFYWSEQFESAQIPGTVWSRVDNDWSLVETADARLLLAELALQNAQAEAWPDRVKRWQMRLEALREGRHEV